MNGLEVVRQTVIGAVEVEPFVFNSCPEIPLPGDEEAMSVAEIVVKRVAVSEFAVVIVERSCEFSSCGVGEGCASYVAVPAMAEAAAPRNRLIKNDRIFFIG